MKLSYSDLEDQIKKLKEELQTYNEILDSFQNPVFIKDSEFKYTNCNLAFTRYTGLPKEQIINSTVFDVASKEYAEIYYEADCKVKELKEVQIYENKAKYADGTLHDVIFNKTPILRNSEFRGIAGIMFDITEKKKSEQLISEYIESLKENEEKFSAAFNKSPDAKIITRVSDGKIIDVNEMFTEYTGFSYNEAINKTTFELNLLANIETRDHIISTLESGSPVHNLEMQFRKKNNEIRTALLSAGFIHLNKETLLLTSVIDITQLKKTEQALQESKAFYKLISDYSNDWEVFRDKNNKLIYCSQGIERLLGYTVEEYLRGISYEDLVHPEDYKEAVAALMRAIKGEQVPPHTFRLIKKNKEAIWVETHGQSVFSETGEFLGARTSTRDITKLKQTELALQESKALYKLVSDYSTNCETYRNTKNELLYCSPFIENFLGYSVQEYRDNIKLSDWIYPEDYSRITSELNKVLSGENIPIQVYRAIKKNKEIIWVETSAQPVFSETGELLGARFSNRDITQLKEAEQALREKEEKILLLMNSTGEGILGLDINGNCTFANKSSIGLLGYSFENELLGKNIHALIHHSFSNGAPMKEEHCRMNRAFFDGVEVVEENEVFWRKDGSSFPVQYFSYPQYQDNKIIGAVIAFFDISEKKMREEELAGYTSELKDLNATKDKFFSIIAHDLKSPFQGLMGYAEILTSEYETLSDEERKDFIKYIGELSKSSYKLLENLLTWSRMQRGIMSFNPQKTSLLEELLPTISLLKQTALNKQIDVDYTIDKSITLVADSEMLSTIVRNLVSNAIKFTDPGGKINIIVCKHENSIQFSIKDTGIGMEKEIVDKLFDLTTNTSTKGTADESGTGLGLILCKEMIVKHGGTITVESELGKGSMFTFNIPINP